jgi:putative Holliday junction resolvase
MARILGLDYGEKRLGFALSDPSGVVATPLTVITVHGDGSALQAVDQLCRERGVERLVIGHPINMDGSIGPAGRHVEAFKEKLAGRLAIPIELWDERMTTVTAERALVEGGVRRRARREVVDKLAAQIMLQHYLDARGPGVME